MAEELSTESKLYVKEEIDKIRKEFKEDLKEAQSKATKTFTTVALIVGLLTCGGVYGLVVTALKSEAITKLEDRAKMSHDNIVAYEDKLKEFKPQVGEYDGYVRVGGIKIIWGYEETEKSGLQTYKFVQGGFDKACFTVIPSLAGVLYPKSTTKDPSNKTHFTFQRRKDLGSGKWPLHYMAIGN